MPGVVAHRHRAGAKRLQLASSHVFLAGQHLLLHRRRHLGAKVADADHAFAHTAPDIAALPRAVKHRTRTLRVIAAPLVRHGGNLRIRRDVAHVRVVGHGQLAALLRCHHHRVGGGVKRQHLHALVQQRHRRIALARRVKPSVQPYHFDHCLGVDRAHAQRKSVDALQHFGNRKTRHITGHPGLAHAASGNTGQIAPLVIARIGGRHIGRGFIAGDGLELHARKVLRHLQRRLHIAKTGGENQLVPSACQVADDALGVGPFGHILNRRGLHPVAQRGFDGFAPVLVLARPAGGQHRRDVDKTNF